MKKTAFVVLFLMIWVGLSSAEVKRFQIPLENSPVIGSETAAVTIVEFIDYQ